MTLRYHPTAPLSPLLGLLPRSNHWWDNLKIRDAAKCCLTASATDSLRLALQMLGNTGRVIAPAYTCDRVMAGILAAGSTPLLVDVSPEDGSFDRSGLLNALSSHPQAILLTHLFGINSDSDWVYQIAEERGIPIIEDSSLLLDLRHRNDKPHPRAKIFSFGRGKPLGLGGGGALIVYRKQDSERLQSITEQESSNKRYGYLDLLKGTTRDSAAALFLSWIASRLNLHMSQGSNKYRAICPATPAHPSSTTFRAISSMICSSRPLELAQATQASLQLYLKSLTERSSSGLNRIGDRIPANTVSPALAIRSSQRNSLIKDLNRAGIDCPRYWNYSIAERMGAEGFLGAKQLSLTLLFLPLHDKITPDTAMLAAGFLRQYDISPFT